MAEALTLFEYWEEPWSKEASKARMDAARAAAAKERLPYQAHSETSREAAETAAPRAQTQRAAVLRAIKDHGPITDEAVQTLLHMNPSTQRPRRIELVEAGLVADSGRKDTTKSGRRAVLWVALEAP